MATAPTPAPPVLDQATFDLRQQCDRRLSELKLDRTTYEVDWREISELICPQRGRYLVQYMPRKPRKHGARILDPTATAAHQRLAAFLMAGITNPSLNWFRLGIGDDSAANDPDVKAYLAEAQKRMFRVLSESNFYNSLHQVYEEIAGFHTAAMICLKDYNDVVRFYPLTIGEYWLALNNRQECDTLYREYTLTVAQIVKEFGLEACSATVQNMHAQKRLSANVVVVHAIEPNLDRQRTLDWRSKPYLSLYFERGTSDRFLRTEGFAYCSFIAPRWHALSGDAYGTGGPSLQALPDVKSLQAVMRDSLEARAKRGNPPMQGDARYQSSYLGIMPRDINWIAGLDGNPHAGIRPVFTMPGDADGMNEDAEHFRAVIKETYFNDLILAISQMEGIQPRNEMEINERRQEKMLMLGPVLERFYGEALAPVVRIVFDIMQAGGLFGGDMPPLPKALHGKQIVPAFISVLAQAQKAVGTSSLEQLLKLVASMAPIWPDAVMKVDTDAVIDEYASDLEVNPKLIRGQQVVNALRQQKAQQDQQQALLKATPALAQGARVLGGMAPGGAAQVLGSQGGTAAIPA